MNVPSRDLVGAATLNRDWDFRAIGLHYASGERAYAWRPTINYGYRERARRLRLGLDETAVECVGTRIGFITHDTPCDEYEQVDISHEERVCAWPREGVR